MPKLSKRIKMARDLVSPETKYTIDEAITVLKLYKEKASVKFDESIDISISLGIDPRKGDQTVRSFCVLPHGSGKKMRVIAIVDGENVDKALAAGAVEAGGAPLIEKIRNGFLDFDKCVATPDMMPKIGPVTKILGPKGLIPNPKLGTVTKDVAGVIKDILGGRVEFKNDKFGAVNLSIAKLSFDNKKISENFNSLFSAIKSVRPATSKGKYILSSYLSTSMGIGLPIEISSLTSE